MRRRWCALADKDGTASIDHLIELMRHGAVALILPAQVAAEVDYMLGVRLGQAARRASSRTSPPTGCEVACLAPSDYATVASLEDARSPTSSWASRPAR